MIAWKNNQLVEVKLMKKIILDELDADGWRKC